jgi:hypothetical protein
MSSSSSFSVGFIPIARMAQPSSLVDTKILGNFAEVLYLGNFATSCHLVQRFQSLNNLDIKKNQR